MSGEPEQRRQGRQPKNLKAAGLYPLLWPAWQEVSRKLSTVAGGKQFLRLSAHERFEFFKRIAVVARGSSNQPVIAKWLCECYAKHPDVTLYALVKLRESWWRRINKRGPDYFMAAAGEPGSGYHLRQKTRDARRDLRKTEQSFLRARRLARQTSPEAKAAVDLKGILEACQMLKDPKRTDTQELRASCLKAAKALRDISLKPEFPAETRKGWRTQMRADAMQFREFSKTLRS